MTAIYVQGGTSRVRPEITPVFMPRDVEPLREAATRPAQRRDFWVENSYGNVSGGGARIRRIEDAFQRQPTHLAS
jgi:hypothetical protein